MPTCTWWIDEPLVIASSNPSDEELVRFRAQGFSVAVSLLEENKQPLRYDRGRVPIDVEKSSRGSERGCETRVWLGFRG